LLPGKKRPFLTAVKEELLRKGDKDSSYAWFAQLKVSSPTHQQEEMLGTTRQEQEEKTLLLKLVTKILKEQAENTVATQSS
jgi:hypothetical protein